MDHGIYAYGGERYGGTAGQEKPFYHHSGCGRILYFPGISVFFWHIRKSWFSPMQPCLLFANSFYGAKIDKKFADYSMLSENQILRQSTSFFLGWLPGVAIPLLLAVGLGIGL